MFKNIGIFISSRKVIFLIGLVLGLISVPAVYAANTIYAKNVTYDNSSSGLSSTNVQDAIDETYDKCFPPPELGAYVSLTPTDESEQELNLWRVININEDGTIDIISEYLSTEEIDFNGYDNGYMDLDTYDYRNCVLILNNFVTRYENEKYTIASRAFGYNGQTESILEFDYRNNTGNFSESEGGGDTLYEKDYNLVMNALGTLKATKTNGASYEYWWVASRYSDSSEYSIRYIDDDGNLGIEALAIDSSPWEGENTSPKSVRPILTLKANLKYTGKGTKNSPIVFIDD